MKAPYLSPTAGLPGDDREPPLHDPGLVPEPKTLDVPLKGANLTTPEVPAMILRAMQ